MKDVIRAAENPFYRMTYSPSQGEDWFEILLAEHEMITWENSLLTWPCNWRAI